MDFVAIVLALVAFAGAAGFVARRWGALWALGAVAAITSLAGLVLGSDGDQETAATSALLTAFFVWLPLAAGGAAGIALGRRRRHKRERTST